MPPKEGMKKRASLRARSQVENREWQAGRLGGDKKEKEVCSMRTSEERTLSTSPIVGAKKRRLPPSAGEKHQFCQTEEKRNPRRSLARKARPVL